ncbi:hypothetical protein [Dyella sp. AD56]|uniref:hypothetical protein n=1 Tax=Dyella sp. AD56 TaxID=1528744 RepID=UPI0011AF74C3|nr:hypothetical protein [Dyella sp. AD56]
MLICCARHGVHFPEWIRWRSQRVRGYCYVCRREKRDYWQACKELGIGPQDAGNQESRLRVSQYLERDLMQVDIDA